MHLALLKQFGMREKKENDTPARTHEDYKKQASSHFSVFHPACKHTLSVATDIDTAWVGFVTHRVEMNLLFFPGDCQSVRVAGEWTWCPFVFLFWLSHIVSAFPPPSLFSLPSLFQSFTHPLSSSSGCLWAPRRVCLSWPFTSVSCTVRPALSAAWPGTPTAPGTDMLAAPICRPCAGREDIPALCRSRKHW